MILVRTGISFLASIVDYICPFAQVFRMYRVLTFDKYSHPRLLPLQRPTSFFEELLANASAAGIPVVIYNGNDDSVVHHFTNESAYSRLSDRTGFDMKELPCRTPSCHSGMYSALALTLPAHKY